LNKDRSLQIATSTYVQTTCDVQSVPVFAVPQTRRVVVSQVSSTAGCCAVYVQYVDSLEAAMLRPVKTSMISNLQSPIISQHTFFHFTTWFLCLSPNRTRTSSHVGFRFPPFPSSTRPCSAQDNTRILNSTVLHRLALEGVAAGRGTQRGATEIGCFRGPGRCLNLLKLVNDCLGFETYRQLAVRRLARKSS